MQNSCGYQVVMNWGVVCFVFTLYTTTSGKNGHPFKLSVLMYMYDYIVLIVNKRFGSYTFEVNRLYFTKPYRNTNRVLINMHRYPWTDADNVLPVSVTCCSNSVTITRRPVGICFNNLYILDKSKKLKKSILKYFIKIFEI